MKPQRLNLGEILNTVGNAPRQPPAPTDRDIIRALLAEADLLGSDSEGGQWLLIRATAELIDHLAAIEGVDEDAEPEHASEEECDDECNGDREQDQCADAPAFGRLKDAAPTEHDLAERERLTAWARRRRPNLWR